MSRYVVISLEDGTPWEVFGPYRTRESADRQARRLSRALDRVGEGDLADVLDAMENPRGPYETPVMVELAAVVLPIEGGPIPVRSFTGGAR